MSDHFDFDTTMEWCKYTIKRTRECRGSLDMSNPMYCVSQGYINPIPGTMFFSSPAQAKKAIAALEIAKHICPVIEYGDPGYDRSNRENSNAHAKRGHLYHMLMELAL